MQRRLRNAHRADVRALVYKAGWTFKAIADRHGLDKSTVSNACARPQPSGNRAIAQTLGLSVHDLWPEWFDVHGNRLCLAPSRYHANDSRLPRHRQKREAC